jgi:hypothetical protein
VDNTNDEITAILKMVKKNNQARTLVLEDLFLLEKANSVVEVDHLDVV